MRRFLRVFVFLLVVAACSVPAYAEAQWPPPVYDMPRVPYDASAWSNFMPSIKMTVKSIGSVGLRILGVCVSISIIGSLFHSLVLDRLELIEGVKRRERNRTVKALDIAYNREAIIEEKVMDMQLSAEAKALFRSRNPDAEMEERLFQRQLAYSANVEFAQRYPQAELENRIFQRQHAYSANVEFARRHPNLAVQNNIVNREISWEGLGKFRSHNPVNMHEKAVFDRKYATVVDMDFQKRNEDLLLEQRFQRDELNQTYHRVRAQRRNRKR